tara:strand:- start:14845 stop:20907 length:6063 start_codon:yes stop_codon:yes gene_type:complete
MTLEEEKRRLRQRYNIPDNVEILTQEEYDIAEAEDRSALQVGFQSATRSVVPGLTGLGAMAAASKALAKVPARNVPTAIAKGVGMLGSAIVGGIAGDAAQTEVDEAIRGEEAVRETERELAAGRKAQPVASVTGEILGGSLGGGVAPSLKTAKGLGEAVKSGFGTRAKQSEAAKYAVGQAVVGAGIGGAVEGARQFQEGDFQPTALGAAMTGGALFTEPVGLGRKLLGTTAPPPSDAPERPVEFGIQVGEDLKDIKDLPVQEALLARSIVKGEDAGIGRRTLVDDMLEKVADDMEAASKKSDQVKQDADAIRETSENPKTSIEGEFEKINKDPKIDKALRELEKKQKPSKEDQVKISEEGKKKIESKISAMSNEDVARAFARLNQRKRAEVSTRFLQNQNKSIEDARAELMAEIETKLPADLFKTARNLANRRNITMRVAVDKLVDNAQGRALGFLHNKSNRVTNPEMVLSLDDINLETPLHETVHRFVRDLFESSNEVDQKLARGWYKELLSNDSSFDLKKIKEKFKAKGYNFDKDEAYLDEFLAEEGGKKLEQRLRNLPKGTFDKMRRWYADVRRGQKVKYGKAAVNDILDYIAQRLELDPAALFDNDLWLRDGIDYAEYIGIKKPKQIGGQAATASKTVDGTKYESSVEVFDMPKEVEELLGLPERPKEFAKNYAEDLNEFKIALDKNHSYNSTVEYLDGYMIDETNFDQFMNAVRKNSPLKKLYKSLDNKPQIILRTRRPEDAAGYFENDKIVIGVPTINETFDSTLARYLTYHKLLGDVRMNNQLASAWQMAAKSGMWFKNYEPYMVAKFMDYALNTNNKLDDAVKAKLRYYQNHLELEVPRGDYRTNIGRHQQYDTRIMHQGDALHGIFKALPLDVKQEFARRVAPVDGLGMSNDEYIEFFDTLLDSYGIAGSSVRKNFDDMQRSPQAMLENFVNDEAFNVIDRSKMIFDRVKDEGSAIYYQFDRLEALWADTKISVDDVLAGGMRSKFLETAEEIVGTKLDILTHNPQPPRPRQTDFEELWSVSKLASEESGADPIGKVDEETPIPMDSTPKGLSGVDRYEQKRYSRIPAPNFGEPSTWQLGRRFTRNFRPVIDRIRELGEGKSKELAGYIASKFESVHAEEREMVGRYLERTMLALSEVHLSGDEMAALGRYQTERWHTKLGLIDKIDDDLAKAYNSNARIRYYDRMIESVYRDTRILQNDLGLKVAVYRNGEPQYVPGQHTLEYTPEIIAQDKRRILMRGEKQSKEYQELKKQLIDYWKSISKDMSDEEFNDAVKQSEEAGIKDESDNVSLPSEKGKTNDEKLEILFDNFAGALRATDKQIGSHKFKALRVATGKLGIPAAWVEANAVQRMTRYVVRFAKDMAMFKHIELDPKARQILGMPDQEGKYITEYDLDGMENGGPFNLPTYDKENIKVKSGKALYDSNEIESVMENYIGYYEGYDLAIRTFNRLVTSSWLGAGAGIRDFFSSYLFALPYMRLQDLPILATHLLDIRDAWRKSFEYGINKTNLNNLEYKAESINRIADYANRAADTALRVGGRNILEQGTRALQFAFGKQITWAALHMRPLDAITTDWTANRLLNNLQKQMGDVVINGKKQNLMDYVGRGTKAPDELMDKAAAAWVEINQGTYDARGLPKFTQRGVLSMVTSLSRWSIEKSDRMVKDVIGPLKTQGDPLPLVKATIGAVIGGEALKYISEQIANKMQSDPKIIEALHMENDKELAYAVLNSMQYAGFFGFQSALIYDLVKTSRFGVMDGIPGGFTFPAFDQASKIVQDFSKFFSSGEMTGENFGTVWTKFIRKTFTDLNQTTRYAANHLLLSEDMSEFNARASLRKWERLTTDKDTQAVPSDVGNEYTNPARREFRKANNIADARKLLPVAVREAARDAMQKHPDNLAAQQLAFKNNLNALWTGNWRTTPALPSTREYVRQKDRIQYLGIEPSKADLARFPDLATINRSEKGAMLSRKFGSKMMPGTIIKREQAEGLIKTEKDFERLKEQKKALIYRYIGSKGKLL